MHIFEKTKYTKSTHCGGVMWPSSLGDVMTCTDTAKLRGRGHAEGEEEDPVFLGLGAVGDGAAQSSLVAMGMAMVVVMGGFLVEVA